MTTPNGPVLFDSVNFSSYDLGNKEQFTIGRSADSDLDVPSKFISRNQCLIKYLEDKNWWITDLSSFKSTRVNGKPLKPDWQILTNGDKITFQNLKNSEYIFYKDSNLIRMSKKRKLASQNNEVSDESTPPLSEVSDLKKTISRLMDECENLKEENTKFKDETTKLVEENKNLSEQCHQVSTILEDAQKSLAKMETEKTAIGLKLVEEMTTNENMILQMQDQIESLKECEMELERMAKEKAAMYESNNASQSTKKDASEMDSSAEAKAFFDINSLFDAVEYNSMKDELENVRKQLQINEGRLNECLAEKDILTSNISDLIEQEFSCSVCSEVLYQAVSLKCRHTFCAKCVATWKTKKKECPVCRTKIIAEINPLVIDSFIDKVSELVGGDFKKRRDDVRVERASNKPPGAEVSPYAPFARRGGHRRTRGSGRSRRATNIQISPEDYDVLIREVEQRRVHVRLTRPVVMIDLTTSPGSRRSTNFPPIPL